MKKLWTKLLTILIGSLCLLTVCACSPKPVLDFSDAKKALEDNGYEVQIVKESDDIYEIAPGNIADFSYAMNKVLLAEGENWNDELIIIEFDTAKTAKKFHKYLKTQMQSEIDYYESRIKFFEYYLKNYTDEIPSKALDEAEDYYKELKDELKDFEEYSWGRQGKIVWYGNNDVIKDTK